MLAFRLIFVKFFVLHEHHCNREIQKEKRANHNTAYKVKVNEPVWVSIFVDVFDFGPAFHGDALEDREEGVENVVKICDSVVQLIDVTVPPHVFFNVKTLICRICHRVAIPNLTRPVNTAESFIVGN